MLVVAQISLCTMPRGPTLNLPPQAGPACGPNLSQLPTLLVCQQIERRPTPKAARIPLDCSALTKRATETDRSCDTILGVLRQHRSETTPASIQSVKLPRNHPQSPFVARMAADSRSAP